MRVGGGNRPGAGSLGSSAKGGFRLTTVVRFLGANGRSGPYRGGKTLAWGAYTKGNVCPRGAKHAGSR